MAVATVQQLQQQNLELRGKLTRLKETGVELQQQNVELRRELTHLKETGYYPLCSIWWYMYLATQVLVTYTLSINSHTPYVYAKELSCR